MMFSCFDLYLQLLSCNVDVYQLLFCSRVMTLREHNGWVTNVHLQKGAGDGKIISARYVYRYINKTDKYCKVTMLRIAVIVEKWEQIFGSWPLSSKRRKENDMKKMARICVQNADMLEVVN